MNTNNHVGLKQSMTN